MVCVLVAMVQPYPCLGQRICVDPNDQFTIYGGGTAGIYALSMYGNIVAWKDNRNGNADVYAYDLETSTEYPIATDPNTMEYSPVVGPNYIFWWDNADAYITYNLDSNTTALFRANSHVRATHEGRVAMRSGDDLIVYDMNTGKTDFVAPGVGNPSCVERSLWGNYIVWGGGGDIWLRDLSGDPNVDPNAQLRITDTPDTEYEPCVYGNYVVYLVNNNEIHGYDMDANTTETLVGGSGYRPSVRLWGRNVVYQQDGDMVLYNLDDHAAYPVYTGPDDVMWPAIYGNVVVWLAGTGYDNCDVLGNYIHPKLVLNVTHPEWGSVTVDPNLPCYKTPTLVTLTAEAIEGKAWMGWSGDIDPNDRWANPLTITVDGEPVVVETAFKCGFGVGPMLPVMLGVLGLFVWARRRG